MPRLQDVDELYKLTYSKLSVSERLYYCKRRLETTQHIYDTSSENFESFEKNRLLSLINSLKNEIAQLSKVTA